MQNDKIKAMTETGVFIAVVFIGVFLIKIPVPSGYMHIGDSMIFLSVLLLGGKRGAIAGGIGAALADLIGGYAVWIVPTLICKAVMAMVTAGLIKIRVFGLKGRALWIVAAIFGGIAQAIGYVAAWWILFGKAAAIAAIGGLAFQTISGIIIAFVIIEALKKTSLKKRFIYDITA